jgi:hypothetical protein
MKHQSTDTAALPDWMRSWERFWFSPADPTLLGLIRITCGLITLYTFVIFGLTLQDTMGPHAWVDREGRLRTARDQPVIAPPLSGLQNPPEEPKTAEEQAKLDEYRQKFQMDLRMFGLPLPRTQQQWDYLLSYTDRWKHPPPAYAKSKEEADEVDAYISREGLDPRTLYTHGTPIWSIWLHVTDPTAMAGVQIAFVIVALLFTLGVGTRVTAALTWFASICYIHRNVQILFGTDTMMNILLLYLTIGPSGAALSVDRLIARWWRGSSKPDLPPAPSVSANVAIRLLQIHTCIIYLIAGLSKLQGASWWSGTALWSVLANWEFAPMQFALYNDFLRFLCRNQLRYELVMNTGCYFTLFFEISFVFLVWWPRTRWIVLGGAIMLHGTIGIFMGLKTFSLIMLIMNMSFLRPKEVHWFLRLFTSGAAAKPSAPMPMLGHEVAAVSAERVKR